MKQIKSLAYNLLSIALLMACQKESSSSTDGTSIITIAASKVSSIKKNEPVVFIFAKSDSATVNWSVSPSANTQIIASGKHATIRFAAKGNYIVKAVAGSGSTSVSVSVSDTSYNDTSYIDTTGGGIAIPHATLPFSAGESIKITASKIDSGAISSLVLSALTTNSYLCLSNSLLSTLTSGTNNYGISFTGVYVPSNCTTGTAKAGTFINITPAANSTNTLTVNFNGVAYTGSIVKSGNSYTINWPYTTGVTISPKTL